MTAPAKPRRPSTPVQRQLPTSEVAERLGMCEDTVRELIDTGQLRARNLAARPGRPRWRVDEGDLAAYLESRTRQVPASRRRGAR